MAQIQESTADRVEFIAACIHHSMLHYWHTSQPWDQISEGWREDMRAAVQAALEGGESV